MKVIGTIEAWYLGLLTIGIGYVILKNSEGASRIVREVGQNVSNLTTVASGGAPSQYGYRF